MKACLYTCMHTHTLSCIRVYLHTSCLSISQSLYLSIYVPTAKARGVSELFMIWCLPVWVPGTVRLSDASRAMKEPGAIIRWFPGHGEPGAIIRCLNHASRVWTLGKFNPVRLSDASRVMGNPVQFTCRRTARAHTAGARTAGTRNTSMGGASAHNASMHSASTNLKHGPAPPRCRRR